MRTATHVVRGTDDELIRVEELGEPDGKPVLVHSGTPGSRRLFRPDAELAAREFGLRLLSYDRPGYGGRPRREGRCIADSAADVRCIAAALGIDRLAVWGHSGGGCYALACAALLPGLVTGAVVLATFAPSPWGCDLTTIGVPVRLWHGVRDRAVPVAHGRWLAANVPGIIAHLPESEDHGTVQHNNSKTAYAWLSGLA
jgi:pimeloyl-ACP methyl ester carboxylesterase